MNIVCNHGNFVIKAIPNVHKNDYKLKEENKNKEKIKMR